MLPPPPTATLSSGLILGEIGGSETAGIVLAVLAIAVLAWQLWSARRDYAMELAEQMRQLREEEENTRRVRAERDALARESHAKSEMIATLSSEIRSHLNGIIGSADLMLDGTLKPQQREHLGTLRASAESLHQSLNDVVDYSSIEAGQISIAHQPFDLRQPLTEVVETLSPVALLKGLELVLIIAPDVPLNVTGDSARVRQILQNLMGNSVKFTARGRVVLRAELSSGSSAPSAKGATWLHFSVNDSGPSIPEEMQATLFERSTQRELDSPRTFGGSGLELAISKRLVELMGGRIGAHSLPEGGVEFWVVLPLPAEPEPAPTAVAADGLHVVVLDDLAASRVAASAMLTRLGVDQDAAGTAAQAVQLLREAVDTGARSPVLLLDETFVQERNHGLAGLFAPESPLNATRAVLMAQNPDAIDVTSFGFPIAAVVRKPLLRTEALLDALRAGPAAARLAGSRTPFEAGRRAPHVLVVDDDAISRSVSSQLLERLGCVVELALNGAEAVALATGTRFDLIFMDCHMPEMDGFTATEEIRAAAGKNAPPIIALTANTTGPDRERCSEVGMCDFVSKPVKKTELAQVLTRWTQPAGAAAK